jgi:hypothetical protein
MANGFRREGSAAADEPSTFASISSTWIAVSASARRRNRSPIRPANISAVNDSSIVTS